MFQEKEGNVTGNKSRSKETEETHWTSALQERIAYFFYKFLHLRLLLQGLPSKTFNLEPEAIPPSFSNDTEKSQSGKKSLLLFLFHLHHQLVPCPLTFNLINLPVQTYECFLSPYVWSACLARSHIAFTIPWTTSTPLFALVAFSSFSVRSYSRKTTHARILTN